MLEYLLEPFSYEYMQKAMWISAAVGGICAFLSAYLMLKGWSLIGDALSHSVVPGVAIAYAFSLPYALGAFFAGILAALSILWIKSISKLKEDAVIGFIFSTFFALGLLIISLLLLIFFDETQAITVGLSPLFYKVLFFTLLSACVVAALQTVGAILVIAMVITPGATAYLLTDKFKTLIKIAVALGAITGFVGVYLSYYLDGATGGVIVTLQTLLFLLAFLFSPKYGLMSQKRRKAVDYD
ncbi:MAG: metal ABC transporter permease [Haemophilus parainfluenzae]|nr:metal ABC transporter permease [Haemophilus parainfluenzae]